MNKSQKQAALEAFGEAIEAFNDAVQAASRVGLLEDRAGVWDYTNELLDRAIEAAE